MSEHTAQPPLISMSHSCLPSPLLTSWLLYLAVFIFRSEKGLCPPCSVCLRQRQAFSSSLSGPKQAATMMLPQAPCGICRGLPVPCSCYAKQLKWPTVWLSFKTRDCTATKEKKKKKEVTDYGWGCMVYTTRKKKRPVRQNGPQMKEVSRYMYIERDICHMCV